MSFKFLNEGRGEAQRISPIDTFIDPVSKIRVSNPSNLIDTDFEYGLQPTKWETVELINNTPAFFSKGGDTTITDITGITTNDGTREITVTTAFPHNLAVGIPIRVAGTKSVTADGSYIINATPSNTSFTYLARDDQTGTTSIFDLYSSIISGEFFQGSQIAVSPDEGIITDGGTPNSTLTIKTENKHGFGPNTPFYFLNLNSTIAQEFEAQNTASVSFDPTNSATAQIFDGSNTLLKTPIDLSNSATTATLQNTIQVLDPQASTITVTIASGDETNWDALKVGDPLYYSVTAGGGYFQSNPRGVVFIKNVDGINGANNTATFQVSELPDGTAIPILANTTGFFQIANQARTFAGNNIDSETQVDITITRGSESTFDAANEETVIAGVQGYSGTTINLLVAQGTIDYYTGAMLLYSTDGNAPSELSNNATYFVTAFAAGQQAGLYTMSIAALPGGSPIDFNTTGSGTQTFKQIGISVDKDIVHVKNANFAQGDMLEYVAPENGAFNYNSDDKKTFFFVETAYDAHNYKLSDSAGSTPSIIATGGDNVFEIWDNGRLWRVHEFTTVGSSTFEIIEGSTEELEYLVIAGGGGGGAGDFNSANGGGGGAGGYRSSVTGESSGGGASAETPLSLSDGSYAVVVGDGGAGSTNGENSEFYTISSTGGGRGASNGILSSVGGSGGGGSAGAGAGSTFSGNSGTPNQGFDGANAINPFTNNSAGGGGGAGAPAIQPTVANLGGNGGLGLTSSITGVPISRAGGGAGAATNPGSATSGGGNSGGNVSSNGQDGAPNTGGGGGGGRGNISATGGAGGSGIVIVRYPITPVNDDIIAARGGETSVISEGGTLYAVHQFKDPGSYNFVVSNAPASSQFEYLIIGGGGGGGNTQSNGGVSGGGGGAGGFIEGSGTLTAQSYGITVGSAGLGGTTNARQGSNGGNSVAFGLTALGGGAGGADDPNGFGCLTGTSESQRRAGCSGGSGGGNGPETSVNLRSLGLQPSSASGGFGNAGSFNETHSGGGGGAGSGGTDTRLGGTGRASSITGASLFYAAGGGSGGNANSIAGAAGGSGIGGNGLDRGGRAFLQGEASPHTGSGGGGGAANGGTPQRGGNGSSGIVAIKYPIGTDTRPSNIIHASGGKESVIEQNGIIYRVHEFSRVGRDSFIVSNAPVGSDVEYLVVGGGGSGAQGGITYTEAAGGGGAGGYRTGVIGISAQAYPVFVGDGGVPQGVNGPERRYGGYGGYVNGQNSQFGSIISSGGGGGGAGGAGGTGGSGGGGGADGVGRPAGPSISGQGNNGGAGFYGGSVASRGGGGGGGAGSVGATATSGVGGNGGAGVANSITGKSVTYAAGGGGGSQSTTQGIGGSGIGGNASRTGSGTAGKPGTGSGGGASTSTSTAHFSGAGGSGIVIVRYPIGLKEFTPLASRIEATGGDSITQTASQGTVYNVHKFITVGSSNFVVSSAPANATVEYLVIAGGGGGAQQNNGGGGGAGGYRCSVAGENSGGGLSAESPLSIQTGTYNVTVGEGGAPGFAGSNSVFHTITSNGGGFGRGGSSNAGGSLPGGNGGSGGGGGFLSTAGGAPETGQGFAGGRGFGNSFPFGSGGGGGAGGVGQNAPNIGGAGGLGVTSSITGIPVARGGGGSGGAENNVTALAVAGGGTGSATNNVAGSDGQPNTGGGGGGSAGGNITGPPNGGSGGSGIVIVRYPVGTINE